MGDFSMTHIAAVIGWKFNHQPGMTTFNNKITEFPRGIPSQSDQDKWTAEFEAHLAVTDYQRKREPLYPPLADFGDAVYWAQKGDDSLMIAYVAACDKVKSDNPKP